MAQKYLDQTGLDFFMNLIKTWGQPELISGTNIKSLSSGDQNVSILGSGSLQFKTINGSSIIGSTDILLQTPITFQSGDGLSLFNENNTVNYTLNKANSNTIGGIKIGYADNENNFGVKLDGENRAYVTIPNTGGGGETYTIVNTDSNGLAPMISKKGEVEQQFVVLASNNGTPGWYSLPSTAFSTGTEGGGETYTIVNTDSNGLAPVISKKGEVEQQFVVLASNNGTPGWYTLPSTAFSTSTEGGGETYTIVNTNSSGLAPMISKKGEVKQQFVVLASNNGTPGWYTLPSTAFSTGTEGGGETYTIVNTDSNGLAPMISKKGEVEQQFIVLASNNGTPGWYSLPSTAFSTGEGVDVKNNDTTLAWGSKSVLATINSIEISTSLPENPCSVLTLTGEIQGVEDDITGYKITLLNSESELANVIVPPPSAISNSDIDNIIAAALSAMETIE